MTESPKWSGEIDCRCQKCETRNMIPVSNVNLEQSCMECKTPLTKELTDDFKMSGKLNQCAICVCPHLFHQRDFNRKLGISLLVLGFALAYWTYGISVLVLTLFDFWLYKRVGMVACCYECGAVYRDFDSIDEVPEFQLQLHDYYKSVRGND